MKRYRYFIYGNSGGINEVINEMKNLMKNGIY